MRGGSKLTEEAMEDFESPVCEGGCRVEGESTTS